MPIYEYACLACGDRFERLVRGGAAAALRCAQCGSSELERLLSMPKVRSTSTRTLAMKAARVRDARQGEERARTQREYALKHED